ncbi:DNA recombination protein RmuC [Sinorhizobium meliloti]|nr:DNA recombination protein RmuC [Sinorhizobium meliloti]
MTHRIGRLDQRADEGDARKICGGSRSGLAVIDNAQNNIQSLAKDMAGLQSILAKQADARRLRTVAHGGRSSRRPADGRLRLPGDAFQRRAAGLHHPPCRTASRHWVIDREVFRSEAWEFHEDAASAERRQQAAQAFRRDMEVHIPRYLRQISPAGRDPGYGLLFVPSESIFAEIHEHFEAIVQKAHRQRIVIVSPSLLLLSIQVIQAILKDARMREQAHLIQGEVVRLMEDLSRLDERVRKLQGHFAMTQKDVEDILISSDKLTRRGAKIEALELQAEGDPRQAKSRATQRAPDGRAHGAIEAESG